MRLIRTSAILATVAAGAALLASPSEAAPTPPFTHAGRWITDADGRVVVLHGLNMVNKLPPYYPAAIGFDSDDVKFLKNEGFNTVRLGIIHKGLEPQLGNYDDAYLARIAATAKLLADNGILPLIDFHQDMYNERFDGEGEPDWAVQDDGLPNEPSLGFPGNYYFMQSLWHAYDHFWANDPGPGGVGLQDWYAAAWKHVAASFTSDSRILGFDIFNEPFPGSELATCANPEGCPLFDAKLTGFTKRVFAAIRQADTSRALWYEPNVVFDFGADTHHGDPGDANAGFGFHDYCLGEAAPVVSNALQALSQSPGCSEEEQITFSNADKHSQTTGSALLLSEFGATDSVETLARMTNEADQNLVSWQYWAYWNRDPCCDRPAEGIIHDISEPPTGDNVKQEKLDVLVRPYPQAVAGTPKRFGFDRDTRTFDLIYSTARAGGGSLAKSLETEVRVPKRQYPRGYRAKVTGGRVVSGENAAVLRVAALPAATEVSLRVVPRR
jgi:endoglycosylceramidase